MAFWMAFLFWLGSSVLSALLYKPKVENARPSGLDDFQVPTATEGRVVPVIVGKVRMAGPNVIWYGDLTTTPIRQRVGGFLGIGARRVTTGYQYNIGVQMAICRGPIGGIDRVWMGDRVLKSGESTGDHSVSFDDPEFFGGAQQGGGIRFTLDFRLGGLLQAVQPYIATKQVPAPAYRSTAHCVLYDGASSGGYIGNAANLRNLSFEPFWYPNSLGVTGGRQRIGDDANPICFLYELLTNNTDWGVQLSPGDILITGTAAQGALRAVAEQVADEGLGFSMVIDSEMEAKELIQEIERHVDGAFRLDLTDGRFKIILARPAVPTVTLDETNIIRVNNFSRANWADTKNELRVGFADRAKEYGQTFALDYDLANREIVGGRRNIATLQFPGVKSAVVANKIAARELVGFSFPLAKLNMVVSRAMYNLQRGDVFYWNWPDLGITNMTMRVLKVSYDSDIEGEISLDAVEDVYRLETVGFVDPPTTGWVAPVVDPQPALDARIWEPPAQLAQSTYQPVMLVARNGGLHLNYDVYIDPDGGTNGFVLSSSEQDNWTPVAQAQGAIAKDLNGPPHYSGSITIDNLVDITPALIIANINASVNANEPLNIILIDDELMYWTAAVDNGNGSVTLTVERGVLGTVPATHADNARVWFPTWGAGAIADNFSTFTTSAVIRAKVLTRTSRATLAIGSAPAIPLAADFTRNQRFTYAGSNVIVNQRLFVDANWTKIPSVLRLSWEARSASQPLGTRQDQGLNYPDPATTYTAEVRRVDTNAIVLTRQLIPAQSTGGVLNLIGYIPQSPLGTPAELDYNITFRAVSGGVNSQVLQTQNFEVFGFGIDFGGDFGGQDTGGPNLGVVLRQGAAPFVPELVPGSTSLRTIRYNFTGTPTGTETVDVIFSFFGALGGTYNAVLQNISGSTPTAIATAFVNALETLIDGPGLSTSVKPFLTIERTEASVLISSYTGGFQGSVRNDIGNVFTNLEQAPKGTTTDRPQQAFLDFWTSVFDSATGQNTDVLAPESGASYNNSSNPQVIVTGLTHAARVALSVIDNGSPVQSRQFGFPFQSTLPSPTRLNQLDELRRVMETLGDFNEYVTVGLGINTSAPAADNGNNIAMTRTGIVVSPREGYQVDTFGPNGVQLVNNSNTGFDLVMKQVAGPLIGSALSQVIAVGAFRNVVNFAAGQQFILNLGGTEVVYTASGADVTAEGSSSEYRDPVMEFWAANLPSGYTSTFARSQRASPRSSDGRTTFISAMYITRTSTNVPFTYNVNASLGLRATVTIS